MKEIYSKDAKGNDIPIAWAMYFPNQDSDKKWKTGSYPLEYYTTVVESENKDGSFSRAAEAHIENNATKESKGKEYPIEITDFKWEKFERKEKSFSWWNNKATIRAFNKISLVTTSSHRIKTCHIKPN